MLEVPCNMYADRQLLATDLVVWMHATNSLSHEGRFHIPINHEVLTGAVYHLELLGEKAKLLDLPKRHALDIRITEVAGQVAHFTALPPAAVAHEQRR